MRIMYLVVWCFFAVILLQAANLAQGELLRVNIEGNEENNAWDIVNSEDQHQNIQKENSKPHIVLIVADDLGWYDVSWHNPKVHTPHLGHLATTGVILNQSYVMHICSPSRSALMTGRYPFTIGRQNGVIRPMEPVGLTMNATLLPQELKKLGYSTHAVGKWHLGFCNWKYTPTKRGFDTFYGYYTGAEDYYTHSRKQLHEESRDGDYCVNSVNTRHETDTTTAGSNIVENLVQENINTQTKAVPEQDGCAGGHVGFDFRNNTTPDFDVEETYSTYVFASHIEKLLKIRNPSDPLFLYMPFQSVHAPLQVPDKYIKPFSYVKDHKRRTFMGMLSALDEAVGRIVRALKETDHYNNSIIVFTTDNGGQTMAGGNNWPLRGRKATLWEGGTRGSAFVHSPLLNNTGTVSNQLVHISDWFATLVDVAGGNVAEDLDSIDQWEAIAGNADPPRNIMVYNLDDTEGIKGGIRIGDYKLLLGEQGFDEWVTPPEGLPKKTIQENPIIAENITEMEINIKVHNTTVRSFNNLTTQIDITTEKMGKENIEMNTRRRNIRKININRRLRNKEKLKQKIRREKLSFQSMLSIKSEDNSIFNWNPLSNTIELEPTKKPKMSNGKHLTVNQVQQRPFIVEAIPGLQLNNTGFTNIRDRPSPKTFADLLNWSVEDLVDYKKLQLRVFNIKEDPAEHHDLADKDPSLVKDLLGHLLIELPRMVPADIKPEDNRANPKYWDNIWSPGWC